MFIKILEDLLGAEFPKIAGFAGLILIFLGIMAGRIRVGPIVIPARDPVGRCVSLLLGVLLAAVPLVSIISDVTIGLLNFSKKTDATTIVVEPGPVSSIFLSSAYAAGKKYTITTKQRTVTDVTAILGGNKSSLYVGDVHLSRPVTFLIYVPSGQNSALVKNGADLTENQIKATLAADDIIVLGSFKQGGQTSFTVAGKVYTLTVETALWYLIGDDLITVSILTPSG